MISLVNDLLDMEKLQSGEMEFYMSKASLLEIVTDAIETNRPFAEAQNISFELTQTTPDAFILGDTSRLAQVMANLLSNATKFSPEGGKVEIALTRRENGYRVAVCDHGPGVPTDFKDRIFDRFTQADATDTRQKGGTGLGLNISRHIIEKHNGIIDFDSEPGNGATFYIELPQFDNALLASPPAVDRARKAPIFNEIRVLVIEDDWDVANLIDIMLQQYGAVCDIAHSVKEAREKLASTTYQAITLDIKLPDGNGVRYLQELRKNDGTKDIPVVVVSAVADKSREEVLTSVMGVMDWLDKPIDENKLIQAIERGTRINAGGRRKILIVEDDADLTEFLVQLIGDLADVSVAATMAQARHALESAQWSLVILDIELPDGSGVDLISLLKYEESTPTPVIIFTADEVGNDIARKVEHALVKSRTSNEDLLATISAMISKPGDKIP